MYAAGTINSETLYWEAEQSGWQPIDELFAASIPEAEELIKSAPISADKKQTTANQLTVATYNKSSNTFSGSMLMIVKLAVRAIQSLNWKVEYVNENIGSVSFEAGSGAVTAYDYSCSLSIEEVGLNTYRVTSTGKLKPRGNTVIALDGGSGKKAAQKAVDRMKRWPYRLVRNSMAVEYFLEDVLALSLIIIGFIILILLVSSVQSHQ